MAAENSLSLPSGAVLVVTVAPFIDAKRLHDAILTTMRGGGLADIDLADLTKAADNPAAAAINMAKSGAAKVLLDRVMAVMASGEVSAAVFKCGERAVYRADGQEESSRKVTPALFDDPEVGEAARKDYYAIVWRIVEVNCAPFLGALVSALKGRAAERLKTAAPASA